MTTYVLSLTGDEEKAANATHWARFRKAKLLSVSRRTGERAAGQDSIVITGQGSVDAPEEAVDARSPCTRDAGALAALLVRTLDIQNGTGVVLADFDSDEFAADVVAGIAALGRSVTCTGRVSRFAFAASVLPRFARA